MALYNQLIFWVGVIFIFYVISRIIKLVTPRTNTFLLKENGKFKQDGYVKFNRIQNRFNAFDLRKSFADRLSGEVQVDNGKAWVRIRKESKEYTEDSFDEIGYVDLTGNIYDKNHCKVGYVGNTLGVPDMNGKRRWYELFLRCHAYVFLCSRQEQVLSNAGDPNNMPSEETQQTDQCIGKCIETGRFGRRREGTYTSLGRAAAFLLLYQRNYQPEAKSEESSYAFNSWADCALLSGLIFAVVYAIFYLCNFNLINMPFLGDFSFFGSTLILYFCIWALVRQIKIELLLEGKPVDHFLLLLNRNTGLSGLNNLIMIIGAIGFGFSVYLSGGDFAPLQLALLISVGVNMKYITKENWLVYDKFRISKPKELDEEDTAGQIMRKYSWELDSGYSNLRGSMELYFAQEEIDDLRRRNPFKTEASMDFKHNIELLFREDADERHISRINNYIMRLSYEADISEFETMQFILDFVQEPNIKYISDADSNETGNIEYARFPVETLFDKRGDCDCKAVLAAALFRNAGYKVAYITSMNHAAIAVACPKEWFSSYDMSKLYMAEKQPLIEKDGDFYFFCETTSDTFRIGDYGESKPEDFINIHYLR